MCLMISGDEGGDDIIDDERGEVTLMGDTGGDGLKRGDVGSEAWAVM